MMQVSNCKELDQQASLTGLTFARVIMQYKALATENHVGPGAPAKSLKVLAPKYGGEFGRSHSAMMGPGSRSHKFCWGCPALVVNLAHMAQLAETNWCTRPL